MKKHCPKNERIKRQYFTFLKEAHRQNEASIDGAAKAISRFEAYTKFTDFKAFHIQQAIGFKKQLTAAKGESSGKPLSKATLNATMGHLKRFFLWLAGQPGYKSRIRYSDAEYFNLSQKDMRVANAKRKKPAPTLEQINHVLSKMPSATEIERRNRALFALVTLTGGRDSAIASLKLKHIDLTVGGVYFDAREVDTKFSKTFMTYFFSVGGEARQIVEEWVRYLREEKLWGNDDPLFPSTEIGVGPSRKFEALGLKREGWSTASPIRTIFKEAFIAAGLPYFNPHSFRDTLVGLGEKVCQTAEEFKAWSQNLGHEKVLTTFFSYGDVSEDRQSEIIRKLGHQSKVDDPDLMEEAKSLLAKFTARSLGA